MKEVEGKSQSRKMKRKFLTDESRKSVLSTNFEEDSFVIN